MTQADNEGITTVDELVSQQEFDYGMVETNPLLSKLLPQARNAPYRYTNVTKSTYKA